MGIERLDPLDRNTQRHGKLRNVDTVNEEFSLAALRQAAQRGRLDAVQGADGIWRSTRRAVQQYKRERGKRRAPSW